MNKASAPIYLDHNASTPVLPEVLDAMLPWLRGRFGNPSSAHAYGRAMRDAVEAARSRVATLIEAEPGEIVFTSGGTEANNLAIRGLAAARPRRRHIVTSVIEHPATSEPCRLLEERGYRVDRIAVDSVGAVDPAQVRAALTDDTLLVTVMHANSETGTLQPIGELARMARRVGALTHTDAAQSPGKVPVSVKLDPVDLLSLAGHKLYAPQGVGALFVRSGVRLRPVLVGAAHEGGLRPGTENVASLVGLGKACEIARRDLDEEGRRLGSLRDLLWERLGAGVPGLALNGHPRRRLPNTLNVRFPGVSGGALLAACPEVAASTGSACHEDGEQASAVITAMGVPEQQALGSVRLTLGRENGEEDIERAAQALIRAWLALTGGGRGSG